MNDRSNQRRVRPATEADIPVILEVMEAARGIMRASGNAHGIFRTIMEFAFRHDCNIRIDTHRDNTIMQHNILKHGFSYCGIILLADGAERLAYQRVDA